jgi:tRNA-2-methylthio-N6-dimethylallyladenosine synthase
VQPRTYQVRTFGCQMNVHDSERMAGMLEDAGYVPADGDHADVVVFNTCAVRENADNKLYGNLGMLAPVKAANPGMQIAVGGCLAQKDRETILKKAPWVDAVFGTHNVGALPALLDRARHNNEAQLEILESLDVFPSTLPTKRDSVYSGWVSISVGCNNTCTFCIVPALRGKEKDRRPGDILAEIQALVDDGAIEVTLLGQNVNSYGVEFGDRQAFSKLLRACGEIKGLERVRFTSPHPAAFTDDVIDAMAETPNVMPQLHMPLQSGSDKVLRDMKRSYRSTKFLGILDKVREKIPHAAISTDIIVGFPGETEEDFQYLLDWLSEAQLDRVGCFQYSPVDGAPANDLGLEPVPDDVKQDRWERFMAHQQAISTARLQLKIGREMDVLIDEVDDEGAVARSWADAPEIDGSVFVESTNVKPGDKVRVRIVDADEYDMWAELV